MKLIAETAWHHDGDYNFFIRLITDLAEKTSADFIKFHITLDWDEYMHHDHPIYDSYKKKLFSKDIWTEVIDICLQNDKKIMLLLNDTQAIDFGLQFNPELVEIHSVALNDINLLKHLKANLSKETKVVLGVGGSTLAEIDSAIDLLSTSNIVLMHGFQNFPTNYEDINFKKIRKIMNLYPQFEHGYADHTAGDNLDNVAITMFGAAMGMDYIEKHVTNAWGEERADWQAAISIDMAEEINRQLRVLQSSMGNGDLDLNEGEVKYSIFGPNKKGPVLNQAVKAGDTLASGQISLKRTGQITDISQIELLSLFGKSFKRDLEKGHCINKEDIIQ